jgi:predicted nucleic acid-binding protein
MPKIIISDTSTLIIFQKIDEFDLLKKAYGNLITTPEVVEEYGDVLPDWIEIKEVGDQKYQDFLETQVDYGEASAIALASEFDDVLLLLDDLKARKLARQLNFKITGTLGIIQKAKQLSLIDRVKPLIDKLLLTDFRISDNIIEEVLRINKELPGPNRGE